MNNRAHGRARSDGPVVVHCSLAAPNAIVLTDTAYNADWLRRRLPVCPQADDLAFDPPGRHFDPVIGMTYVKDPRYVQND